MMRSLILVLIGLLVAGAAGGASVLPPVSPAEWTAEVRTMAARSCVGEAGFSRYEECGAILWVYLKKRDETNAERPDRPVTFGDVMLRYSAALKPRAGHPNPWIFDLTPGMEGPPKRWPSLSWPRHKALWASMLAYVDAWARGQVSDRWPQANEYGGPMDRGRARAMGMRHIAELRPGGNDLWRSKP